MSNNLNVLPEESRKQYMRILEMLRNNIENGIPFFFIATMKTLGQDGETDKMNIFSGGMSEQIGALGAMELLGHLTELLMVNMNTMAETLHIDKKRFVKEVMPNLLEMFEENDQNEMMFKRKLVNEDGSLNETVVEANQNVEQKRKQETGKVLQFKSPTTGKTEESTKMNEMADQMLKNFDPSGHIN